MDNTALIEMFGRERAWTLLDEAMMVLVAHYMMYTGEHGKDCLDRIEAVKMARDGVWPDENEIG